MFTLYVTVEFLARIILFHPSKRKLATARNSSFQEKVLGLLVFMWCRWDLNLPLLGDVTSLFFLNPNKL